jgi:hypothetical protein
MMSVFKRSFNQSSLNNLACPAAGLMTVCLPSLLATPLLINEYCFVYLSTAGDLSPSYDLNLTRMVKWKQLV